MSNIQEEGAHGQDLALILTKCISQAIQKFKGNTSLTPIQENEEKGRSRTTTLVMRESISFNLPKNCDMSQFKDINLLTLKLKDWVIEKRQRESKLCDTSYIHASSRKKFRSVRQIVNHILPEEHTKIPAKIRKNEGCQGGTSTKTSITPSSIGNSMINERTNKCQEGTEKNMNEIPFAGNGLKSIKENENNPQVISNVSMETVTSLPEVQVDIADENEPLQDDEIDEMLRDFKENVLSDKVKENNPKHLEEFFDYDWMFDF